MNTSQRMLLIGAALIGLSGCTINNSITAGPGGEFSYSPDPTGVTTFAIANSKPAEFPDVMDSNERVRHVFGYPLVSVNPMGQFLATHAMASTRGVVDQYLNQQTVTYGLKPPSIDDMVALGAGIGGAGGAALAGLSIASADKPGSDMRERSAVLCFVDSAKVPSAGDALIQCQNQVAEHLKMALGASVAGSFDDPRVFTGSIMVSGRAAPERVLVMKRNSWYATGFAPKDKGGFAAHIFKISFFTAGYIDKISGHALVEDLAKALAKNKPQNLVYRISASDDYRTRAGLEGLGLY